MAYQQRIAILRPAEVPDRYSTEVRLDYDNPTRIPVDRPVSLQPVASREQTEAGGRFSVVTGWALQTPPGMDLDLRDTDRVEYAGRVLSVLGDVLRWPHPIRPGAVHHIEATLEEVRG